MAFDEQFRIPSPTGASLNAYRKAPTSAPRGVVQINHGLAEHAARYERFADFLAAQGFHVYAHDHRGHGETTAPDAPPRLFGGRALDPDRIADGAGKVIADVVAVQDRIADDHPGLPLIVFGHSMGGLIALNVLARHSDRVAAAAIWNANFSAGLLGRIAQTILAWEMFRLGSDVPSRMLPRLTFRAWAKQVPNARTDFDWLSRDPVEVDRYIADPLCGWDASVSMWADVFKFVFGGADDRNLAPIRRDLPLNLLGGGNDPATDGGKAVTDLAGRLRRMGFSDIEANVLENTRHESLSEINRDTVMADFVRWLDRVMPD